MIFLNVIFNFRFVPNNAIIKLVILRVFPPVLSHWKNKLSITKLILFLPARNVNRSKSSSQPNFLFVLFSVASQHIKLGKKLPFKGLLSSPSLALSWSGNMWLYSSLFSVGLLVLSNALLERTQDHSIGLLLHVVYICFPENNHAPLFLQSRGVLANLK